MKNLRQVFLAIGLALASIGLVLGSFSLSLAEGAIAVTPGTATHTLAPTNSSTLQQFNTPINSPTPSQGLTLTASPSLTLTPSITLTSTWTPTSSLSPTLCPHPLGWLPYIIRPGDTLAKLAIYYKVSLANLQRYNCLLTPDVAPGTVIYVPPVSTPTAWACGQPPGWVIYIVQPGDTLFHLSQIYGVSVAQLQKANCIADPNDLLVGQKLYVPYVIIPLPTIGPIVPTFTPSLTLVPGLPSDTPVSTDIMIPTETPVPTDIPIPTETTVPTDIPIPTDIPTATEPPVTP